jgi:hypothetical protein
MNRPQQNLVNWKVQATEEGFLYFYIPGTNTYQWSFPKDGKFLRKWVKKVDMTGRKYWENMDSKMT